MTAAATATVSSGRRVKQLAAHDRLALPDDMLYLMTGSLIPRRRQDNMTPDPRVAETDALDVGIVAQRPAIQGCQQHRSTVAIERYALRLLLAGRSFMQRRIVDRCCRPARSRGPEEAAQRFRGRFGGLFREKMAGIERMSLNIVAPRSP